MTCLTEISRTALFVGAAIAMSISGCTASELEHSPGVGERSQAVEAAKEELVVAQYIPTSQEPEPVRVIANYAELEPDYATLVSCPSDGRVAFSVSGAAHVSEGPDTLLGYGTTYTNIGGGWTPGGSTFIAPCAGLYTFTVSFLKDAYYYDGTTDDVYLYVMKNGVSVGFAWSGAGDGLRSTGTYTIVLQLAQGDYVQTYAFSDNAYKRHLASYHFSGVLVHP